MPDPAIRRDFNGTTAQSYKPRIVDAHDCILKVTGSTVCGSDLHLYHGSVIQMQKGDILGHEVQSPSSYSATNRLTSI